jgi:DNA-binding transcriptional ArsR family regulator
VGRSTAERKLEEIEEIFTALAHSARRRILLGLHFRRAPMSAGEIASAFPHSWATTSGHLRALEEAGLLEHEKVGRQVFYRINRSKLARARAWLEHFDEE